jgi:hypothetical protein
VECQSFDRWLNAGRPGAQRADAHRHAESCSRCEAELAAARELTAALSQRFATAPDTLTDRILDRIAAEERTRPLVAPPVVEPSFPWWIRVLLDPATVLSCLLAAVVLATAPRVFVVVSGWAPAFLPTISWDWLTLPSLSWLTLPILGLPLWAAAAIALYRGSLRWVERPTI